MPVEGNVSFCKDRRYSGIRARTDSKFYQFGAWVGIGINFFSQLESEPESESEQWTGIGAGINHIMESLFILTTILAILHLITIFISLKIIEQKQILNYYILKYLWNSGDSAHMNIS